MLNLNNIKKLKNSLLNQYEDQKLTKEQKIKILAKLGKIQEIEKSEYRYNTLLQYGLKKDAEAEKKNLKNLTQEIDEYGNTTIHSGVSYNKYVWMSSGDSCDECQALDGEEFENGNDIPDKPHPNCQCTVEPAEGDSEGHGEGNEKDKGGEPCDCVAFNESKRYLGFAFSSTNAYRSDIQSYKSFRPITCRT